MINDIAPRKRQEPSAQPHAEAQSQVVYASFEHSDNEHRSRNKKNKRFESWRSVLTTVAILLLAPLFALFLTAYVFQTYQVDGPSMKNTLQPNDRLIVWKVQRTWARITGNPFIPERGDIIVFSEPRLGQFGQSPGKQLIKRVIGLPGERVVVKDGVLTIFNDEHPSGFQPDREFLEENVVSPTMDTVDTVIPKNHIFVAGDNRTNSLDSRSFGPVHVDNIVGKLTVRILPLGDFEIF